MSRRANGEGSVFRRERDGAWVATLTVSPRGTAAGYRKEFTGSSRKLVLDKRDAFRRDLAQHRPSARRGGLTLGDFGRHHLTVTLPARVTLGQLSAATLTTYQHLWAVHIEPAIGHVKLVDLTPPVLEQWMVKRVGAVSQQTGRGFSLRTRQAAYNLLRALLNEAVRLGELHANPLSPVGVRAPRGKRATVKHIEDDDLDVLLDHLQRAGQQELYSLVLVLYLTGARSGEALGARWSDIDLARSTWHISGTMNRGRAAPGEPTRLHRSETTKTKASDASIPLSAAAVAELQRHRARQEARCRAAARWDDEHDLVFATRTGRPLAASNVLRALKREAALAGLTAGVTLHRLRHSAATSMLEEGVSAAATSRMLRHSSVQTTLNTYAHVTARMEREAVEAVDAKYLRRRVERAMGQA